MSKKHIFWLRQKIKDLINIKGHIVRTNGFYRLKYAKNESKILIPKMFYRRNVPCLRRKYKKLEKILYIDNKETKK
ncbi:hypothetical protein KJ786_03810 [Patescibacteria group bacterium]|nr:hypothetical protein [Patescibacteria group bacterium]